MKRKSFFIILFLILIIFLCGCNDNGPVTPNTETQEYKYAASKESKVFHYIDCFYVEWITPENLILFKTRKEAIASGRRPCEKCMP